MTSPSDQSSLSRASRTAFAVALRRAVHQIVDRPPVLEDPLAIPILGPKLAAALRADPRPYDKGRAAPFLRAFMAVRSRFAEDQLAHLRAGGLRQYVVLGAGLDTSAYRDPTPELPLRVWEVDHPATQAWKRERLEEAGIAIPSNVTHVAVDFERQSLGEELARAGFDADAGSFFAWLGVTPYLSRESIVSTLTYLARATTNGGGVVFDYALAPELLSPLERVAFDHLAERVRAAGEPWRSFFEPAPLEAELRALGFAVAQDGTPEALNLRYLAHRTDGLRLGTLAHLMWAGAAPPAP